MTTPAPALMTPAELAARLGKGTADYWTRRARKRLVPHVRLGRSIRFTEADLARIVAESHVDPTDPLRTQSEKSRAAQHRRRTP